MFNATRTAIDPGRVVIHDQDHRGLENDPEQQCRSSHIPFG
jgi:hypothetical protein